MNDGSKDNTWGVIMDLITKRHPNQEIIGVNYKKNAGKGYAVKSGMKYARGNSILMLDADGATQIKDYEKLNKALEKINSDSNGIAIGSRYKIVEEVVAHVYSSLLIFRERGIGIF